MVSEGYRRYQLERRLGNIGVDRKIDAGSALHICEGLHDFDSTIDVYVRDGDGIERMQFNPQNGDLVSRSQVEYYSGIRAAVSTLGKFVGTQAVCAFFYGVEKLGEVLGAVDEPDYINYSVMGIAMYLAWITFFTDYQSRRDGNKAFESSGLLSRS